MVTDDNIDSNVDSLLNKQFQLRNITNMLADHMNTNNIAQMNFKNTRYVSHQIPSCIDHIYSNVPNKVTDVEIHINTSSDHSIITTYYNYV